MGVLSKLFRAGLHTVLLFVLPWLVGTLIGAFFDAGEVVETRGELTRLFALFVVPMVALQLIAISVKIGRERRALALDGRRGFAALVEAVERHVRILTGRGIGILVAS